MRLRGFRQKSASATLALVAAATLAGCFGNSNRSESVGSKSIVTPHQRLVSSAQIATTALGSPERAFLRYWSDLQYSEWSAALSRFEPALVDAIGGSQLIEALKTQASYFPTVAPSLRRSERVGDEVVVRYQVTNPAGNLMISSISWRQTSAGWRIHYDPQLDGMLQAAVQARVQSEIDPQAVKPSKRAVQAGLKAARVQSEYLGRRRKGQ